MPYEGMPWQRESASTGREGRYAEPKTDEAYAAAAHRPLYETAKGADEPVAHRERPLSRPKRGRKMLIKL